MNRIESNRQGIPSQFLGTPRSAVRHNYASIKSTVRFEAATYVAVRTRRTHRATRERMIEVIYGEPASIMHSRAATPLAGTRTRAGAYVYFRMASRT